MAAPATIGLDIGSVSIRAVEVTRAKDRPMIDSFGQALLPAGATVGGVVKDEKAVTSTLRHLWSEQKFRTKSVRLGVTHQQVVVREVEIADLPPKEMRLALPHQVRDVLPLPVDQAILDFYPLEKSDKNDTVRGLLVAAPKEAIIDTVRAVEKAGLHVEKVDLSCFAVLRALAVATDGPEAIVDLGANGTLFVIHTDGIPQIVRTIPRGGDDITRMLSTRLGLDAADANALKQRIGSGLDPLGHSETDQAINEVINEAIRPLLNEIRSSITYFVNGEIGRTVSRVSVVGGASQLPGFTDLLGRTLGLPVVNGDPLQYVAPPGTAASTTTSPGSAPRPPCRSGSPSGRRHDCPRHAAAGRRRRPGAPAPAGGAGAAV